MDTATTSDHVLRSPIWLLAIRGAQIVVSIVVLGLAAALVDGAPLDEWGLAIATAVITWVVVGYILTTELVARARVAYHIIAVLSLDAFLLVLWLATWASNAAARARFSVYTGSSSSSSCWWDGTCFRKRDVIILYKRGADMMAAIAGLGALIWLLFIASFVWTLVMFLRGRKDGRFPIVVGSGEARTTPSHLEQQQQSIAMQEAGTQHATQTAVPAPYPAGQPSQEQPVQYGQHWYPAHNTAPHDAIHAPVESSEQRSPSSALPHGHSGNHGSNYNNSSSNDNNNSSSNDNNNTSASYS